MKASVRIAYRHPRSLVQFHWNNDLRCRQSSPNVCKSTPKWYDLFTYGQRQRKPSKENTQTWHRSTLFHPPLPTKDDEGNLFKTKRSSNV